MADRQQEKEKYIMMAGGNGVRERNKAGGEERLDLIFWMTYSEGPL
jgi:hypothetical protein